MSAAETSTSANLREALRGRPEVALAFLFGSRASGGAVHAGSDWDVALLPATDMSLADELRLQSDLAAAMGADVDLVRLDRADPLVLREVARAGIVLVERTPGLAARFRADAMLEWLELEPLVVEARRRFLRRVARGA